MGVEDPKGGRPTKLTPELIEKAKGYIAQCKDDIHTTDRDALSYVVVDLPSVVSLARFLGIHKVTVYDWIKENEADDTTTRALRQEFSNIVKEVEDEQELRLINSGAGGLYQQKIAAMLLGKRGYSEKTETDITSGGEKIVIGNPEEAAAFNEWRKQHVKGS